MTITARLRGPPSGKVAIVEPAVRCLSQELRLQDEESREQEEGMLFIDAA